MRTGKENKGFVAKLLAIIMPWSWRGAVTWVLKVNLFFLLINLVLLLVLSFFFEVAIFMLAEDGVFSMLLLLDSGIIFLAGGLMSMASSIFFSKVRVHVFHSEEKWSQEEQKKRESKANLYILMGIVLFVESIVSGFMI